MAKPFRPKRGTTAKNDAFVGKQYEITLDKEKSSLRVHDGVTAGGVAEILPKAKNDELYAPKDLDVGVTSFNGEKGAVSYTAPVTSVDGKTGAVDLSGVYQPKGNYLTSAPVTSVMGQTGAVTGLVLSVNGVMADPSGNVAISVSNGTVSQKINTTISGKNATVTISNLTLNKPLFVVAQCQSEGNYATRFYVNSGVALNATVAPSNGFSGTQGKGSTCWLVMIPTGTSVSIVAENTIASVSHSVVAYQ